jgi:sec-independent protein translocase protein TatA
MAASMAASSRCCAASARAGPRHAPPRLSPPLPSISGRRRQQEEQQPEQQQQRLARGGVACRGLFGLGLPELAVIAGVAALIFGPSQLPELGKGLGQTVKSFQTAAKEFETELKAAASTDEEEKKEEKKEQA